MKLEKAVQNCIRTAHQAGNVDVTSSPHMSGVFELDWINRMSMGIFYPNHSEYFLLDAQYKQLLSEANYEWMPRTEREAFVTARIKALRAYLAGGENKVFWLKPSAPDKAVDAIHVWQHRDVLGVSHYSLHRTGRHYFVNAYLAVNTAIMRRGTEALALASNAEELREQWLEHFDKQFVGDEQLDLLETAAHLCEITEAAQPIEPANCNVQPGRGQWRPKRRDAETNLPEGQISFAVRRLRYDGGQIEFTDVEPMDEEEYRDLVEDGQEMAANDDGMAGYEDLPVIDLDQPRRGRRQKGATALHGVRGHWRQYKTKLEPSWVRAHKRGDPNKVVLNKVTTPRKKRK